RAAAHVPESRDVVDRLIVFAAQFRYAEIDDLDPIRIVAARGQHYVFRLEVSVNDTLAVSARQCFNDLSEYVPGSLDWQRAALLQDSPQAYAVDVVTDD